MIEKLNLGDAGHEVGPFSAMHTRVHCELSEIRDETDQTRVHEALTLHWKARSLLLFPVMRGMITVRPNGQATEVRMDGSYTPPLGVFGELFDRIIGRHIARRTVERFLDQLHDSVEREWQNESKERASRSMTEVSKR